MEDDLAFRNANVSVSAAAFGRMECDFDFIAGFECGLGPPGARHPQWIVHFERPVRDDALLVLGIEIQRAVRISSYRRQRFHDARRRTQESETDQTTLRGL